MTACGIGGCSTRGRHDRSTWGESGGARAWGWWRGYSAHRCILCVGCTQPILLGRFDPMRCLHRVRPHPRPQPTDAPCPPPPRLQTHRPIPINAIPTPDQSLRVCHRHGLQSVAPSPTSKLATAFDSNRRLPVPPTNLLRHRLRLQPRAHARSFNWNRRHRPLL
jgi:hypothetical protein